jgi:hypothetical protein
MRNIRFVALKKKSFFTVEKEIKGLSFKWCWKEVKEKGKKIK